MPPPSSNRSPWPCTTCAAPSSSPGEKAVVIGGGPIGVLIATVARAFGAEVAVIELDPRRRAQIEGLGFDTLDPREVDQVAWVEEWTGGAGADVVFEVSGAAAAVLGATALAKVRGTIVVVAIHPTPREIDLQRVFWRELRILGARVYQRTDFERAVELIADGTIPSELLITAIVPLAETRAAFAELEAGRAMKVLVDVQAGQEAAHERQLRPHRHHGGRHGRQARHRLRHGRGARRGRCRHHRRERHDRADRQRHRRRRRGARALVRGPRRRLRRPRRPSSPSATSSRQRHVDILVNNAGTIERAPAAEHPLELWDRVVEVNLSSQFVLTQAVAGGDARTRPRQDHLHREPAELPGRHQRSRVRRGEVRHRRPREGALERVDRRGA